MGGGPAQDRYHVVEGHLALVIEVAVGGIVAGGCCILVGLSHKVNKLLAAELPLLYRLEDTGHVNRVEAEVCWSGPFDILGLMRQLALLEEMVILHSECFKLLVRKSALSDSLLWAE